MSIDRQALDEPRLAVTVLGSGGPIANPRRASTGYLVWLDGVPRMLVDAGGGTYERAGRLGADLTRIDLVLLTHTHIDHTADVPALLFSAFMSGRTEPVTVIGPSGREQHPGCGLFCELLFGEAGAWSYLRTFDGFDIAAREAPSDPADATITEIHRDGDLRVRTVAVPHGMMPALAYRIDYGGRSVCFSGDIAEAHPPLAALAQRCDLLVHHQAVPTRETPHSHLHASPGETALTARNASAGALLLSHFMLEAEEDIDEIAAEVRAGYAGPVLLADDLMRLEVVEGGTRRAPPR